MVAELLPAQHPILGAVATAREALVAVRDVQPVFMSPAQKQAAITELARLEATTAELKLRIVATAEDAACQALARDTGGWLAGVTRADFNTGRGRRPARRSAGPPWTAVAAGMADGDGLGCPGAGGGRSPRRTARPPRPRPGRSRRRRRW